jgi:hypothetical protein
MLYRETVKIFPIQNGDMAQGVECLFGKCKALSKPSRERKEERKEGREGKRNPYYSEFRHVNVFKTSPLTPPTLVMIFSV